MSASSSTDGSANRSAYFNCKDYNVGKKRQFDIGNPMANIGVVSFAVKCNIITINVDLSLKSLEPIDSAT